MSAIVSRIWHVSVKAPGEGPLSVVVNGHPFNQEGPGSLQPFSPVEYLLVSVAGCFALSCRAALSARGAAPQSFAVEVRASKARTGASRLESIQIVVHFAAALAGDDAAAVVRKAKELCTVTNTIAAAAPVHVELLSS